ncbi:cytochrome c-type biogenesis protein CcmH [bacterium]|nr:cytochrome c-type biogenesis protein CcmH [bacterium]
MSKQEIMDAMVGEYGRDVLALPSAGGFGLAAWITPALVLLVAGAFIVMRLRLWKQQSAHAPVPHSTADVVHRRIEEELSELRNP